MVLDGAAPVGDDLADNTPASDIDTYSSAIRSSQEGSLHHLPPYIDLHQFPRPIPILGRYLGFTDGSISQLLHYHNENMTAILQRPLTRPEWEAITYHTTKNLAISSYGFPVGCLLAAVRCEYPPVKAKFKFPFKSPDPRSFNPHKFGPWFKGQAAVTAWHTLRRLAYTSLGGSVGKLFFASYGFWTSFLGSKMDPRLSNFVELMSSISKEEYAARKQHHNTELGDINRPETMPRQPPMQRRDDELQASSLPTSPARDYFDLDEASPTAGDGPIARSQPSEASWDRVRRHGFPGPPPRQAQRPEPKAESDAWARTKPQAGAGGRMADGDSFTFTTSEGERQLAKDEAQNDFDARIEQERRGQDFDGSNRSGWRR